MYKPKSPMASSKAINFSPSPQSRRKTNNMKTHIQQSGIYTKPRSSINAQIQQKNERKSIVSKKAPPKNIQVQTKQFIDSFKIKQSNNNNQTPKFCVKIDVNGPQSKNQYGNGLPFNFFSFGQKYNEKIKTQRKVKQGVQKQVKQITKSPKQIKKKQNHLTYNNHKNKQQISSFETGSKHRKNNQSFIR